jgi:hypothetical protein
MSHAKTYADSLPLQMSSVALVEHLNAFGTGNRA